MLAHAIDHPAPSTVVLISGDRDFAYALSILRLRCYRIVLVTLSNPHPSLTAHASLCFDWVSDVLEPGDLTWSHRPISPRRGKSSLPPVHDKNSSESKGHNNPSRFSFQESYDGKCASSVGFMTYFQDERKRRENSWTVPKHDARRDFLLPDLENSKTQPITSSVASDALRNGPKLATQIINSPIASTCPTYLNSGKETPMTTIVRDANPSQITATTNTSAGGTPKFATCGSIMQSKLSAHSTLRGTASLSLPAQHQVASVKEPISFKSAMGIPPTEIDRGSSHSSQRGVHSFIRAKPKNLSSVDQMDDDGDPDSPPAHSDASPPPNGTTSGSSASVPPFMPPSSTNNATVSAQSLVKATNPLQPTFFPDVLDKFSILIECLRLHKSKGRPRPLRSRVGLEISRNGITYRQAGVSRFSEYVAMAEKAGIVELGGSDGTAWVALRAPWYDAPLS